MKVLYVLFSILFIFCKTSKSLEIYPDSTVKTGNNSLHVIGNYNTWDIGGHLGLTFPRTDISGSGGGFAFGVDAAKFFSHSMAIQARLMHASISGQDINRPDYRYNTTINYDLSLNLLLQLGNVSFLRGVPNLAFYGTAGIGLIHYSPEVSLDGNATTLPGIYSQYSEPLVIMDYQGRTDFMLPVGLGVKYRIKKNISITAEYSYRTTNTDKLDGFFKLLSADDNYSYFNAGVTYHLGDKEKMIEWENPMITLYDDLKSMQDKIDLVGKDTDNDGVADLFDKEPGTKAGSKVYGDGTSVDSDHDGVPDIDDVELFSGKDAKVDASGREIVVKKEIVPIVNTPVPSMVSRIENKKIEKPGTSNQVNTPVSPSENIGLPPGDVIKNVKDSFPEYVDGNEMPSVYFGYDDSKIKKKYYQELAKIAVIMKDNPQNNYKIVGVCDGKAGNQYNINLGKRRAENVKNYLINNYKIKAARLKTETLRVTSPDETSNPMNRRVDIITEK